MNPTRYLVNRRGHWYFRRRVPADCRSALLGRREITQSLGTRDLRLASAQALPLAIQCDSLFSQIRTNGRASMALPPFLSLEAEFTRNKDGSEKYTYKIDPKAIKALQEAGMTADQIDDIIRQVIQRQPLPSVTPTPSHQESTAPPSPPLSPQPLTLSELIDRFNQDRCERNHENKGWEIPKGDKTRYRRLTELLGPDRKISEITPDDGRYVQSQIRKLPANPAAFRGRTIHEVMELAKQKPGYPGISAEQVNNHIDLYLCCDGIHLTLDR